MNSLKYVSFLLLPLCVIFGYSLTSQPVYIGNVELEKHEWVTNIKDKLAPSQELSTQMQNISNETSPQLELVTNSTHTIQETNNSTIKTKISKQSVKKPDTNKTAVNLAKLHNRKHTVMVIGDSMAQGLQPHFEQQAKEYDSYVVTRFKVGSSTFYWANGSNIAQEINAIKPDVVLIVLGANEWQGSANPKLKRAIKKLVGDIHSTQVPYVWIGPPIKIAEKYQEMLTNVVTPHNVFSYLDINVTRSKDKIHPSRQGFSEWSKMILAKLKEEDIIARNN